MAHVNASAERLLPTEQQESCVGRAGRHDQHRECTPCRLHKLQQKHAQRQKLAQRAQAVSEDEIAWADDTPGAAPAASRQQPAQAVGMPADKVRQAFVKCVVSLSLLSRPCWRCEADHLLKIEYHAAFSVAI